MTAIWTTLGVAFLSALLPFVNIEAYLAVAATQTDVSPIWLAVSASVGQMTGKIVWYCVGAGSTRIPWIARKLEKPRTKAAMEKTHERVTRKPWSAGIVIFVSAFTGFPPFAVLSYVAGLLKVNLYLFLVLGLIGRFLRFWLILESAGTFIHWIS